MSLSEKDRALKVALEEAFGEPIHIPLPDYLGKVLAGMFCRQPDMSGDQRARLNPKERRAVDEVASGLLVAFALLQAAREEASRAVAPVAVDWSRDPETGLPRAASPPNPQARIEALEKIGALGRKPVIGKHQASNYVHLRDTIAALDARDLRAEADTIVWLCWWRVIDHNREEFLVANAKEDAQARIAALEGALTAAADQLHRIMRVAEMSSGIMLDPRRTGNWPGAQKTADAFDRIGLRAAEAKAAARAALNQGADHD